MSFKNCSVVYFKSRELSNLLGHNLKGKIVISDFPDFNKQCTINGLIHVLNTNPNNIPSTKIDCIICNSRDTSLEDKITRKSLGIPIVYYHMHQKWCAVCGKLGPMDKISKFCSEKCMKKYAGFGGNSNTTSISDLTEDLAKVGVAGSMARAVHKAVINNPLDMEGKAVIKFEKRDSRTTSNQKKNKEKFQSSMVREAVRLEYALKRESYKKEMRQPSLRKARISEKKSTPSTNESSRLCKSRTKKGKQCTNRATGPGEYCGITSHSDK
jgi:hypothetical protein